MTELAGAVPVDSAGVPECGGGVVSWGVRLSPGVWCRGGIAIGCLPTGPFLHKIFITNIKEVCD